MEAIMEATMEAIMEANGGEWRISAMLDTCMEITVGDRDGDGIPLRRGWRVLK